MMLRLNQKISIGICLIVTILMACILWIGNSSITQAMEQKIREDLTRAKNVFEYFQKARFKELLVANKITSEIPSLKAVISTPEIDHATVLDQAQETQNIIKSDLLIISDSQGKLLASVSEPERYGENLALEIAFQRALQGEEYLGIWSKPKGIYQVVASPIMLGEDIIGSLVVGYAINQSLLNTFANMTNCEVILISSNQILASSSMKLDLMKVTRPSQGDGIFSRKIDQERYLFLSIPLGENLKNEFYLLVRSLDKELLFYKDLQNSLLITACVLLILALMLGVGYARGITYPLRKLRKGVQQIAQGDLTTHVSIKSRDEIGELADSFNTMAEELKSSQEKLFQLEKLRLVGQLAAGVAHEVKNPLQIMLVGLKYTANKISKDDKEAILMMEGMQKAVTKADKVIKDLLDLSKPVKLDIHSVSVNRLIESSLILVKHALEEKEIKVNKYLNENIPNIKIDKDKIEQVFVNIFTNSVQAIGKNGNISIRTQSKEITANDLANKSQQLYFIEPGVKVITIEIDDTGEGIPEDQLKNIFEPFFTTKSFQGGTGLGLAIVHNILELHRGKIFLRNRKEGGVNTTIVLRV